MNNGVWVIGVGSLMHQGSLQTTCPGASVEAPCRVYGWRRTLDLPSDGRVNPISGKPANVVNCLPANETFYVNGTWIFVPEEEFPALAERERIYEGVQAEAKHFQTGDALGEGLLWKSPKPASPVPWHLEEQIHYIQLCVQGAREQGEAFLQEFLETTFVQGIPLEEHPEFRRLEVV